LARAVRQTIAEQGELLAQLTIHQVARDVPQPHLGTAQVLQDGDMPVRGGGAVVEFCFHGEPPPMCSPSQNAEERDSVGVCPAFAAAKAGHKVRPGNSIAIQSVLYNHLSDVLPLFRLWQVQVEPVALALGHVHQEGIDLNSNSCELYAVEVVERSLVAEGNL